MYTPTPELENSAEKKKLLKRKSSGTDKLSSEYYGESADYTHEGGLIYSEILLPNIVHREYAERKCETFWNAVEKLERGKNAQLSYSFDVAVQNQFSMDENIALARRFLMEYFVSRGMNVDFAVHLPTRMMAVLIIRIFTSWILSVPSRKMANRVYTHLLAIAASFLRKMPPFQHAVVCAPLALIFISRVKTNGQARP